MRLVSRLGAQLLTESRLDPYYYRPEFLDLERSVKEALPDFYNIGSEFQVLDGTHDSVETREAPEAEFTVPFLRSQDIGPGYLIRTDGSFIRSSDHHQKCKRSAIKHGDVLLNIMASTGEACVYEDEYPSAANANRAVGILRAKISKSLSEKRALAAFLSSPRGGMFLARSLKGSIQQRVNLEDIRECAIPRLSAKVEIYIGDKVRQADRLRRVGTQALKEATSILEECLHWKSELLKTHLSRRLGPFELADRLDGNYNSPTRLFLMDHLNDHGIKCVQLSNLADVSAMIGWKGLTTEHYTEDGPWLLRGFEIVNGVIDFDALVSVAREKYDEQPQIHLQKGDVALSKDGTIGKAAVVPELPQEMAVGSTVARLRLRDQSGIHPYYMEHVLNHDVLQIQIRSFATGMAQPHITQEWIERLEIPRCRQEDKIASLVKRHHSAIALAKDLTLVARFLVEALIEHRVSEAELVAVQKACESGDRRGERSLLSRMTRRGIDVPGAPAMLLDWDELDGQIEYAVDSLQPAEAK